MVTITYKLKKNTFQYVLFFQIKQFENSLEIQKIQLLLNLDVLYILSVHCISNYNNFKIKYSKSKKLLFKECNLLLKYLVQLAKDIFDHHDNQ